LRLEEPGDGSEGVETVRTIKPRILSVKWWTAAAAVLGILAFSFWKISMPGQVSPKQESLISATVKNQVATRPGNRTQIELLDGTKVWLNADSKLTYKDFEKDGTREVYLEGEAFFDVESDPSRPFIIHTEKTRVKVTGTTLNVRDYPGESKAETSLLTGKAEVYEAGAPEKVYHLRPNDKVVFTEKQPRDLVPAARTTPTDPKPALLYSEVVKVKIDSVDNLLYETAWVNDQLAFSDESFRDVADKMEKWYGVKIVFAHEELESMRFGGKFKDESLTEALMALQFAAPFQFEIRNKTIIITKN
jgi:ferric-dicitrate binding protein FerR (iron transport regulator)